MISCFENERKKKDQIARAKKLNPKRDKTQTCLLSETSSHFWL